ncbi:MAG: hypothetical protein OHK0022_39910 [Roseiflexaceae bacterium]
MIEVYLEVGAKRTFASAVEWPGWSCGGRDAEEALRALVEAGPRYAQIVQCADPSLHGLASPAELLVVEQLEGDSGTEFGVPSVVPSCDTRPLDEAGLKRLQALLRACWDAFDAAVASAVGVELRKGPRGGGRELDAIVAHVREAERSYLAQLGGKPERRPAATPEQQHEQLRQVALDTMAAAMRGEIAARGPRGGVRWPPRYFARRAAWHLLDHIREIAERRMD